MRLAPNIPLNACPSSLKDGLPGIFQTVSLMRALVNQYKKDMTIRQAAISATFLTPEKNQYAEIEAVFNFVRDHIRYVRDIHNVETILTPDKVLQSQVGDCDDQSTLVASMLESIGYPTRFVCAGYTFEDALEHVYVQVFTPDGWLNCDPTEQHPLGYAPPDPTCLYIENV